MIVWLIPLVILMIGWVFHRRTSSDPPPERLHLIGGSIALATGIVALILT